MDAFAMRDPLLVQKKRAAAALYAPDKRKPVGRIVFTNDPMWKNRKPPRIRSNKDLLLYVSNDNKIYSLYEGDYEVTPSVTEDGLNRLDITGLAIKEKYVKLAVRGMPMDRDYTMVLTKDVGQCQIYDTDGTELPSVWGLVHNGEELVEQQILSSLNFAFYVPNTPSASCALDYGNRAVGFSVGEPDMEGRDLYYYGVAEFTVPKAMEHKVKRFEELARYPFDGFMFNTRSHTGAGNGVEFGYNPEVLEKFKARYGHDYNGSQEDIAGVFQIRADSIAEFFRRCKALSDGRPIYLSANRPLEMKDDPDYNGTFGPMPWPYKKMFAEGSLDGVMMSGPNFRNGREFSDYFTKEITGGRDIKIGLFREMGCAIPKNYDFAADMQVVVDKGLDEVELYESLCITDGLGKAYVYPTIKKIHGEE
jgi:hypothetical protein